MRPTGIAKKCTLASASARPTSSSSTSHSRARWAKSRSPSSSAWTRRWQNCASRAPACVSSPPLYPYPACFAPLLTRGDCFSPGRARRAHCRECPVSQLRPRCSRPARSHMAPRWAEDEAARPGLDDAAQPARVGVASLRRVLTLRSVLRLGIAPPPPSSPQLPSHLRLNHVQLVP